MSNKPTFDVDGAIQHLRNLLSDLKGNRDIYDVSTFKQKMEGIVEVVDLRPEEDKTDFSFKRRRKTDK